jgi:sporulation protein YlmC with PRC-barrel domain
MHLVRDLLDNQVRDKEDRRMGKVDGVLLIVRGGRAPRVAAIELGLPTLAMRISERLGRRVRALEQTLGVGDGEPVRIPMDRIEGIGIDVRVDIDANRTAVYDWERWFRRVLIGHLPGAGAGGPEAAEK